MIGLMLLSIIAGIVFTQLGFVNLTLVSVSPSVTDIALYILLFIVGFDIGRDTESLKRLFWADRYAFLIPLGTIIGTMLGGMFAAFLLPLSLSHTLAIASGFGWYSLSAVIISKSLGADLGSIAFLANMFREVLSIVFIPLIAKYMGGFVCIAPAGATSMDTTLPIINKYGGDEAAVVAFIHGFVLSALVPVFVSVFI